jgi:hypothetical protein
VAEAAVVRALHLVVAVPLLLLLLLPLLLLKTASWTQAGLAAETIGSGAAADLERRSVTGRCGTRTALLWQA